MPSHRVLRALLASSLALGLTLSMMNGALASPEQSPAAPRVPQTVPHVVSPPGDLINSHGLQAPAQSQPDFSWPSQSYSGLHFPIRLDPAAPPVSSRFPSVPTPARPRGTRASRRGATRLLGWYSSADQHAPVLDTSRSSAANAVVVIYGPAYVLLPYLQRAATRHVRVFLQPDPSWIEHRNWSALGAFIREYRAEPAVYAWYLYDEPDHNGLAPEKLDQAYRVVKRLDNRPVGVSFMSDFCRFGRGGIDPRYAAGFDILMFDYYPFWVGDNSRDDLRRVNIVDRTCHTSARALHKPFILILQGFGHGVAAEGVHWRDPRPYELRDSYRAALRSGATGVLFWADWVADPAIRHDVSRLLRDS